MAFVPLPGVRQPNDASYSNHPERSRSAEGQAVETQPPVRRNLWIVKSAQLFAQCAQLARRARDWRARLRKTTLSLFQRTRARRARRRSLQGRIADPRDRERFLALVREAMAKSIHKGDPLPMSACAIASSSRISKKVALGRADAIAQAFNVDALTASERELLCCFMGNVWMRCVVSVLKE
jgi:hypothetical protein